MTGLFGSLGTATRGMTANQAALQTSSHNTNIVTGKQIGRAHV